MALFQAYFEPLEERYVCMINMVAIWARHLPHGHHPCEKEIAIAGDPRQRDSTQKKKKKKSCLVAENNVFETFASAAHDGRDD